MKWMLGIVCLLAMPACQKDRSIGRTDSASHWMQGCNADAECGPLACICGVCTLPCADAECAELGGECALRASTCAAAGGSCEVAPVCEAAPAPLCVTRCGSGLQWTAGGECEPIPDMQVDQGVMDMRVDARMRDMTIDARTMDMAMDRAIDAMPDQAIDLGMDMDLGTDMEPDVLIDAGIRECSNPESTCQLDVLDCEGRPCSALFPTGPCVCTMPEPPRIVPCAGGCCGPGECGEEAVCQGIGLDQQNALCNAMPEPVDNECVRQRCTHDADCGVGFTCIRPGEWGHVRSACVPARCVQDSDCDREPGGQCLGYFTPCYNRGFACAYPSDPCRQDADCDQRGGPRICLPREGGGTECTPIP
jgi:hypothetical protein